MISILLGFLGAAIGFILGYNVIGNSILAATLPVVGFVIVSLPLNLIIKKKLQNLLQQVQSKIQQNQAAMQKRMNQLQNQAGGSAKGMQKQMEKKQTESIKQALKELDAAGHFGKWNFLAGKQINTLKGQLNFQIGDFEEADKCFEDSMNSDHLTVAMKMVRAYKKDDWKRLRKLYKKGKKRFKDENAVIIYALFSWILTKEEMIDEAISVLNEGQEKTESEVLANNWQHLVNGKTRKFSNAGLGDTWYALKLEKPKTGKVRQRKSGKRR